ncbi:ABC transporter permease [Novosphingobium album (ex Liu et al. 2023)]|uniref:ABC transporter permease n=1 Tax=Novosphingobium album (ex Liu et al. 2023) TaxID=3031130 RepID=A0ABT5WV88_9SPHN|nr:ABC transporter permease [Novosphingobium album (ex Liu et al. 2023)]MDE8653794.1 ABC transporter permease [Novosphingobium album (ex Liu et al. 2023)]
MNDPIRSGRLSTLAAAFVVARRDFTAILFSRSFFFFLLGPLFPVVIALMAGGVGQHVNDAADHPRLGVAMATADVDAMLAARGALAPRLNDAMPELVVVRRLAPGETIDARVELARGDIAALLTGTPRAPVLTGTPAQIAAWQGPVSLLAAQALGEAPKSYPQVALAGTASSSAGERKGRLLTAQAAQTLLFLLTMLLAGMVLSNLVEEKSNKIIEILAAAIPMDAVFFGKLFAMLGVSFVGIAVWASLGGSLVLAAGSALPALPAPAVGWPLMLLLGVIYFAMAYLLLGSVFLSIGSMASTVREVQTLSMPVTMLQLMNFFLASYAMTQPGSPVEIAAIAIPFSSPFTMLARAAQDPAVLPQIAAIAWQGLCVVIFVRLGARLFRSRVMKSGPTRPARPRKSLLARLKPARA